MLLGARQDYSYLDMKPVGSGSNKSTIKAMLSMSTSPIKSPKTLGSLNRNNNYMDMSMSSSQNQQVSQSPRGSMDDYLNMSPTTHTMNHQRVMDIDLPKTLSAPEGYMEMFWNKPNATSGINNNNNNNNIISEKPVSDEYIYMNAGRPSYNAAANKNEPRLSSLPIDIQLRKKSNIPSTTATRCDSKDSGIVDSGIVTPSGSHPAMFPFSPSSQTSIDESNLPRKCLVDGTTGTLRLSEEEEEQPMTLSFTKTMKVLNTDAMDTSTCLIRPQVDVLSNEYADMTLGGGSSSRITMTSTNFVNHSKHNSDFSNMRIEKRPLSRATSVLDSMTDGDYAVMNPARKLSAPIQQSVPTTSATTTKKSVLVTIGTNSDKIVNTSKGFKPIPSSTDEMLMRNIISPTDPVISRQSAFSRQLSERPASSHTDSTGYEMLHIRSDTNISYQGGRAVTTRPNSVNSEKIAKTSTASLTRPNSVNCDRLTTSSSSSTSTLCGSSSSSSTLCGSKCQSPSQNIRPQSFSETDAVGTTCAVTSRPPSVSSERGLHYASLDLPTATDANKSSSKLKVDIGVATSATDLQQSSKSSSGDSSSPSPNANNVHVEQPSFTYAQIDFAKSCERAEMNTHNSQ